MVISHFIRSGSREKAADHRESTVGLPRSRWSLAMTSAILVWGVRSFLKGSGNVGYDKQRSELAKS